MKINLDRYNQRIRQDTAEIEGDIKSKGASMGIVHRADSPSKGASLPKIKGGFREADGAINVVTFKLRRSLIIGPHKGAGKGMAGTVGSKWTDKYGNSKSTNPKSFGKMATGNRVAKPFVNDVLDSENGVDKIATTAAEELGDAISGSMFIK